MPGRSLRLCAHILLGLTLAGPVLALRRKGRGQTVIRWWMRSLAGILGLHIRVRGPRPAPATLWCSNHVSWLDVVALGAIADLSFVSKAEVRGWPLIGWLARAGGTVFLQRGAGQSGAVSQRLGARLQSGQSVLIFPEGTTSEGLRVGKLYPRLLGAAVDTATPIQPVALRFSERGRISRAAPFVGDDTFASHLLRVLKHGEGIDVDIRLLPQINPEGLDRRSLAHATRVIIQSELDRFSDSMDSLTHASAWPGSPALCEYKNPLSST